MPRPRRKTVQTTRTTNHVCPNCGSTHNRLCKIIYEEQTGDSTHSGDFSGYGYYSGYINGRIRSSATYTTGLARKVAPPQLGKGGEKYLAIAGLIGIGYIIAAIVTTVWTIIVEFMLYKSDWFTSLMQRIYPIAIFAPIVAVIWLILKSNQEKSKYHRQIYLPKLQKWYRQARCYDCDTIFDTMAS